MSSRYIDNSAYAVAGYTLTGVFQSITIGSAGIIGGPGIIGGASEAYTIANAGRITGTDTAISLGDGGTVANTGKIRATAGNGIGVRIAKTGLVTNTGTGVIQGDYGVSLVSGSVGNAGTIIGIGTKAIGVYLATGTVTNLGGGSIEGNRYGVAIRSGGGLYNAASGTVSALTVGVGIVTGTATNHGLIDGKIGIKGVDAGTVTNYGTIESTAGASGIAVDFTYQHDTFVDEAGSVTVGMVVGDGGTLALAGATGTLSGLGMGFSGFGTVDLVAGAHWVVCGSNTVTGGFNVAGKLYLLGTLGGAGTLTLAGAETLAPAKLTVADLALTAGDARLGSNLTYAGSFAENRGALALGGHILALKGAASFTGGTIDGSGNLQTFGTTTLAGLTLDQSATWQDYGTVTDTGNLTMGDTSGGTGRLVIEAGGTLNLARDGSEASTSLSNGSEIVNTGLIEETGIDGYVGSAIDNSGTIDVIDGTLILVSRITGTGSSTIGSTGTLILDGSVAATQTVTFASTGGGQFACVNFDGTLHGFGGSDQIVVHEYYYASMNQPTWSQDGSVGTLTLVEGSQRTSIVLFGQYTSANFRASQYQYPTGADTLITYVPTGGQAAQLAPSHH